MSHTKCMALPIVSAIFHKNWPANLYGLEEYKLYGKGAEKPALLQNSSRETD